MRIFNSIHLDRDDPIKSVGCINNFFTKQLDILFESGNSILIDEAVLDKLDKYRTGMDKNEKR